MDTTIKKRIEEINSGRVPEGYENTSFGIFPCDWENKKFQQICDIFSGGTPNTNVREYWDGDIPWCVPTDITSNSKYIWQTERNITRLGLDNSSSIVMPENSILMCSRATIGPRCINKVPMATNQGFKNLVCKKGYEYEFIYYYIDILLKNLLKKSNGSTFLELSKSELEKSECVVPNNKEQSRIAEILMQWDKAIELQEKLIKSYQNLKKYYLSKMFPKKGSPYPEIRFAGFTEPWGYFRLGEVGKARSGVGFPDSEQGGSTGIPFFKVSDMNLGGNESEMTLANNYVTSAQIASHRWSPVKDLPAIFFAKVGAAVLLNRKRLCRFPFLLDNNTMAYSLNFNWDADFAKALFETIDLTSLIQVGALPSYSAKDVEAIEICLPIKFEQVQIGVFFKNIDNLIAFYQSGLTKLIKQRKALQQYLLTGIVRV